jgi:hypothetical protein
VLKPPVTLRGWLGGAYYSSRGPLNGCTGAELLLCATGGADSLRAGRTGAPD